MTEILYTTEDLSKMFGVGKSTIKRWSDEGKLHCYKTPGGHRKFKSSSVQQFITQFRYETINTVSEQFDSKVIGHIPHFFSEVNIEESVNDAVKGRHESIEARFLKLFESGLAIPAIFDTFLTVVLRKIQFKMTEKTISTIEFQIAKNTFIRSLIHFADRIPKAENKNIEMYCLSVNDGMNEVELKAVELLLENLGITVYNLGTILTKYAAEDIVHQCKPEDVFIVLSFDSNSRDIIKQFSTLVTGVHNYGGQVYSSNFLNDSAENFDSFEHDSIHLKSFTEIVNQISLSERIV